MIFKKFLLPVFLLCSFSSFSQKNKIVINVKDAPGQPQISRHIYGHFAEHLGRSIYGGIYVGEDNKDIPNTGGIRTDVIEALKDLQVPNLRWPGGCFADTYHWRDGIGPKDQRTHTENMAWGNARESNAFGTHEFLDLCEKLGAEPYLAVNMNSGTVREAVEWVQYVNHANGTSYLTDLREENGRKTPWGVKYWGVGNESWDCGGHMTVDYYVNLYKRFATAMTSYSNTEKLFRIAVGPGWDDYNWTEQIMKQVPARRIEGLSIHHYSVFDWSNKGSSYEFTDEEYFKTMKRAWFMEEFITKNSGIMDRYDAEKHVALIVDEWGGWYNEIEGKGQLYQQNTMRDAMIAGLTLNIFNNHADRVRMANLAQTVNVLQAVILTEEEKMVLTPTYHVMKMYAVHQDARLLAVDFENIAYKRKDEEIPALSVSASKDEKGRIHISLVNLDLKNAQEVSLNLNDFQINEINATILRSEDIRDHNTFDDPENIVIQDFKNFKNRKGNISVEIPPFSVVVMEVN